ncbi:MAG TPA: MEKHLA domain-containing protein [Polyangiaceae bacterium]
MTSPPAPTNAALWRLNLLVDSYQRLTGRHLIEASVSNRWQACWAAPRVIVAHGIEPDPIFFYGNQLALSRFEMDFATFTCLPSRYSAEPLLREEREALLARVRERGFIDDYAGVRVSASGKRFRIEQAVVWNLLDEAGQRHGQAATFEHWRPLTEPDA